MRNDPKKARVFANRLRKHFTMERKDILALLARRMAKLPTVPKKVLAMYYYENMRLLDIANCLGLAESRIRQIHLETIASLKTFFYSTKG
jgi:RNA polymerase sigma factor for flagellar operon FliA